MKKFIMLFMLLLALNVIYANNTANITNAICCVYNTVNDVLPVLAFVLMILAGAVYAAGQFFGAEMRAKAVGWAMNMITGAIIGLILNAVLPSVLSSLSSTKISSDLCTGVTCT